MKKTCLIFTLACAVSAFGQTATSHKKTARKKTAAKTAVVAPQSGSMTVPKGAVLDPKDGNYHYTDKSGRKWVYMMTPMGASRWEEKGGSAQPISRQEFSRDPNLKAIDQGETVKFVRTTPFGPQTWTKRKSELTDDERSMLPAAAAPAAGSAQN